MQDLRIKYPRTPHLPWSEKVGKDDRKIGFSDINKFYHKDIVITEKMDGENFTLYSNYLHARSKDSGDHVSRHWLKNFHSEIKHHIPKNWRICGENLWAKHSISYKDLPSFFLGFSMWDDNNVCLSWQETIEYFELIGIEPVPVLYAGQTDTIEIFMDIQTEMNSNQSEGYVVRIADEFHFKDFRYCTAKFVFDTFRPGINGHWLYNKEIKQNRMRQ
jgi:hypothetical protein